MNPDLTEAAAVVRRILIESDHNGHAAREFAFQAWRPTTLFPQAVNRWVAEIGQRS